MQIFKKMSLLAVLMLAFAVCASAQVTVAGSTGANGSYTTLKGAFDAVNANATQTGNNINVTITGNTTETATAELLAGSWTTLTVRPTVAATVTGSIVGAIIKLNGADNVTIDGRIGGTGTTRSLTVANTSALGSTAAVWLASGTAAGSGATGNTIRNLELAGGAAQDALTVSTFGIIMSGTTISTSSNGVDNDNNSFIANRIIRVRYGIVTRGTTTDNSLNAVVIDNIIGPAAFGADQIGRTGILLQADTGATVSRNTVQFVGACLVSLTQTCTTGSDRTGIGIGTDSWSTTSTTTITSGDYTVTRNIIHDVVEERTFSAAGVVLGTTRSGAATNNLVANNFIYNIRANGTSGDQVIGIGVSGGNADRVVFNSISLTGDMDPGTVADSTNFGNGIRIPGANAANNANFTVADNSILVDVTTTLTTTHFYPITLNSATYSFGTGSLNYNNYYINPANPQLFTGGLASASGAAATTEFQTLANWRTALTPPQDANSIQADPQYISNTADLHIAAASPNVNAGTTITGVTTDIDGQVRVGIPDIGADEPAGTTPLANDIAANSFVTPANGASVSTSTAFAPQASFINNGTVTQTNVPVRFRITNSAMTIVCNVTATIPAIDPGQTLTVTFPTCTLSAAGTYTIQATSELVGDQTPGNDSISGTITAVAPVGGTITVGTGGAFTSLTNAGGLFATLNAAGASSNVTINIISDLTGETGAVALNELAGGFTVTIKPSGGARSITGAPTAALIALNGADNVTIDGSTSGGVDRSLTINFTSGTAGINVGSGTNGAQNNTIKNVSVVGYSPTAAIVGIGLGSNTVGSAGVDNDGNRVQNNSIQGAIFGITSLGASITNKNTGTVITQNTMTGTGTSRIGRVGIYFIFDDGGQITQNTISGITSAESADAIGIAVGIQNVGNTAAVGFEVSNAVISRNSIGSVAQTATFSAVGIALAASTTGTNVIANNMISGVVADSNAGDTTAGIFVGTAAGGTQNIYFNSVSMTGDRGTTASQQGSFALAINGGDNAVNVLDNILVNSQIQGGTGTTGNSYAVGIGYATFANLNSNYNDFLTSGANGTKLAITGALLNSTAGAAEYADLASYQTATGKDANSKSVNPLFVSPTDLHLQATSTLINMGIAAGGITVDFDGQTRDAMPDIGADEIISAAPQNGTLALSAATYTVAENVAGGTITITVNRTSGSDGAVGATYALTNGTATGGATCAAGVDFVNTGGTVSFAAGATTQTFTVAICNDTIFEGNETFNVTLSAPTGGATLGTPATATVTINDDEMAQPGMLQLSAATYSVGEAGPTATITVTRTGGTDGAIGATYALTNGTATGGATCAAGVDFINTGGTVSFANGATTQTFTVAICNDTVLEGSETFNVTLSAPTGGAVLGTPATAVVTIIDDEVAQNGSLQFNPATYSVGEAGGTVVLTVTRTGGTDGAVSASYSLANGTAMGGATCAANVDFINTGGTVSFINGQASQTFTVAICNDTVLESSEAFTASIAAPTGGATIGSPSTATVTIVDDEVAQNGSLALSAATYTVAENVAGGTVTVTVTRTGGTDGAVGATYALTNGTATGGATCAAGVDFINTGGTVSFANGATTQTFTAAICNDTIFEGSETFNVTLSGATGGAVIGTPAAAVVTITDDEVAQNGTLQLSAATYMVAENVAGGTVTVTVNRTGGSDGAVGATVALTNGTATGGATCAAGVDFVDTGGTVSFANGATTQTFTVAICNDTVLEGNETFNVTLSTPTGGATLGTPATAVVTILDDEIAQPGTLQFGSPTFSVGEAGGTATLTVTRTGGTDGAVTVNYTLANGTASGGATCAAGVDFVNTGGTVSFANGEASKTFTVAICNDTVFEGNETFTATLAGAAGGAVIGTPATATVTIVDDETAQPGTLQLSAATYTVAENVAGGTVTVTVNRTGGSDGAVGATYALTNGTATGGATCAAGVDFVNTGGTVSFANGATTQTFTVAICNDTVLEGNETFNVTLSGATGGATIGTPATAVITILDDEMAQPGSLQLSAATYTVSEAAPSVTITVNRTGGTSGAVAVNYTLTNGTATGGATCAAGVDFVNTGGTVSFTDGQASQTLTVTLCPDALNKVDETFNVTLSGATGGAVIGTPAAAVVTITNDDPIPTISINSVSQNEGNSGTTPFVFTVTLSAASGQTVTVNYFTADGTATAGSDYTAIPNTVLTFAPGESSKTITVQVNGDTTVEPNETFTVNLATPTNATIATAQGTGTIVNDDSAALGSLSINDVRVFEGNSGTVNAVFTVTLSAAAASPVTVSYSTANGTATSGSDYAAIPPTTLTFAAGETTKTVTVTINGDLLKEANETFFVNLSVPTGATIADPQGVGIIVDNDRAYLGDFDRDLRTDLSVFRPSNGFWYILQSTNGIPNSAQFGLNGDIPVPGDYDADGITDLAVWRPANGFWYILQSSNFVVVQREWGISTDKPVQGDFDGDARTDLAVYRNGIWFVIPSSTNTPIGVTFGAATDVPVQGDYDGDFKADYAVYRSGVWYVLQSSTNTSIAVQFGTATDKPIVGDFDGDGKTDFTVYRGGTWFVLESLTNTSRAVQFGTATDIPTAGDYDGDGTSDIAVFRPSIGVWFIINSSNNSFASRQWGASGDVPIPAAYQNRQP